MKPYYQDDLVTIYHGDSRDLIGTVKADHIVTDPPYGIDKAYSDDNPDDWRPEAQFWAYCAWTGARSLHMTVSNRHLPYWLIQATTGGWEYLHTSVYWNETREAGNWNGQFAYAWEPLLSFTKGKGFKLAKRMMTDVFRHEGHRETDHPAERTLGMWADFISHLPAGMIFDPFLGSGTTLRACKDLGRGAIGIEREERWCETAANRCAQESLFRVA